MCDRAKITISLSELKLKLIKNNESGVTWWRELLRLGAHVCLPRRCSGAAVRWLRQLIVLRTHPFLMFLAFFFFFDFVFSRISRLNCATHTRTCWGEGRILGGGRFAVGSS